MRQPAPQTESHTLSPYLSPIAVWALAFGCSVGWGSFVMPGTTFLPIAGPVGAAIGLLIGAVIMVMIGVNYRTLMVRYPGAGGAYTYAKEVLGSDHGFLCAWMLILTYIAVIWANATALSLIIRYLLGDVLCFGFSYQIAGYTVYMGEVLLSVALLAVTALVCIVGKRPAVWIQIACAVLMFVGISITFVAVVVHRGSLSGLAPAFSKQGSHFGQVMAIVILAPWAFIGFESISHSAGEFRFSIKKSLPIMIVALLTGALSYIMLTLCAGLATPDGFANWSDYIASLGSMEGIQALPTFYAAREAMGNTGLTVLGIAAFCGIATGLIGHYIALSRLLCQLACDGMIHKSLAAVNRRQIPYKAILFITGISCVIPFFGRTAIGWIVDVTTIGATIVYTYMSIAAFRVGRKENNRHIAVWGLIGTIFSLIFALTYLLPSLLKSSALSSESYLMLIIWSVLGIFVFRMLMRRDHERRLGKSVVVWLILMLLIVIVSIIWIRQSMIDTSVNIAGEVRDTYIQHVEMEGLSPHSDIVRTMGSYITNRIYEIGELARRNVYIQTGLLVCSLAIIFSIFTIIKNREKQIEREKRIAEENSRAKSTFLSNMSHDIRTPMNAVIGYTTLALREEDVPEKVRGYLEKIDDSGKYLLSLINDILDMSRIESGKVELHPRPADLCRVIDEVRALFGMQMEEKPLTYTVKTENLTDRFVVCDTKRLLRVLMNLVSNAYKFTPAGGSVSVILRQLDHKEHDGVYEFVVSDTGIGMSPEFAEHLFDAFERERSHTINDIEGSGLGMSIAKSFIELMDGSIAVETEKDKGTAFTIRLQFPVISEEAVRAEEAVAAQKPDFTGKRLLLAEDNPINTEIACAILTAEGFTVDPVENGQLAVEKIAAAEPGDYCAVLMDIRMPVMNGYEATRAIRAIEGERGQVPIIALTANTFEDDRREAEEAGMNALVAKPITPEELSATIASLINP